MSLRTQRRKFWQFRAAADDSKVGELLLYGIIGADGDPFSWMLDEVTPKQFKEELDALGDIETLRLFINSDGGDVFAAQAILSMLRRHPARVEVYIDGLAASAATVVAMAGDVIRMPRNAMMMIHNPWSWGAGDATFFRQLADTLDQVRESIVAAYDERTGLERDRIVELMDAETWMTAEEAVELGFADEIEEAKAVAAMVRHGRLVVNGQEMDLSRYKRPPNLGLLPADSPVGGGEGHPTAGPQSKPSREDGKSQGRRQAPLAIFERKLRMNERRVAG